MITVKILVVIIIVLIFLYILKVKDEFKNGNDINYFYRYINKLSDDYIDHNQVVIIKQKFKKLYKEVKKKSIVFKIINRKFINDYKELEKYIEAKNEEYTNQEIINASVLNNINGYRLDLNQKNAVISNELNTLVVAGAGSGKSLTIIGKIIYLINRRKINPRDILCISFTNDATNNLKKNLCKNNTYDIDIYTFHKLALNIIKQNESVISIVEDNLLSNVIDKYFENNILKNEQGLKDIVKYFAIYIDLTNIETEKIKTIKQNEIVFDKYDYVLANYLYINGIEYTYKHTPEKSIFKLKKYNIVNNREVNTSNNKDDIDLYQIQFNEGNALKILQKELHRRNVKFKEINYLNLYKNIYQNTSYLNNLKKLIETFINLFKSDNYDISYFDKFNKKINKIKNKSEKVRQKILVNITQNIYSIYQYELKNNRKIDFNDMINMATNIVNKYGIYQKYKYIIIDEYQDTSITKYELIKSIINKTNAKLMVVGDDWQSIYGFTGCTLDVFLNFDKYYGYTKKVIIENTYRNSQELIDIAGNFIQKNNYQLKKKLKSTKHINNPVQIVGYTNNFNEKLEEILLKLYKDNQRQVMLLGRNNSDLNRLSNNRKFIIKNNCIEYTKVPELKIYFLTVHRSKGLEEENVVLLNADDKIMGFPNKIIDDKILIYVKNIKEYYEYEEERRLFYVALTRTKNKIYILVNEKSESIFIKELKKLI